MTHKTTLTVRQVSAFIVITLVLTTIFFLIIEGLASSIFVAKEIFFDSLLAERHHTQYDEELGWVNVPNLFVKDLYRPGKSVRTNSQLFRHDKDFTKSIPVDKVRIICSGDSFTMGYGVDNDDTWCQLLVSINDRIESVNMGQAGYGVDQAYLWYKRNSTKFDHDIHLFAFITEDFKRMQRKTFHGYAKPVLELQNGVLFTKNTPVPKRSYYMPRLTGIRSALPKLGKLKSIELLRRIASSGKGRASLEENDLQDNRTREIVLRVFQNLQQINQAKTSSLVLVYLPVLSDYMGKGAERWRKFLHAEAANNKWLFIDLIEDLRKYPPQEVSTLFRSYHYRERGNAYIADILYKKLRAIPEISYKLQP